MERIAEKSVSNVSYLFLTNISITLISFLFWIVAGKSLLPSDYGKVNLAVQIIALSSTIGNIGTYLALSKIIPELIEKKEIEKIPTLIKSSIRLTIILTLLTLFPLTFLVKLDFLDYLIIFLTSIIAQITISFQAYWYGYQKMRKIFLNSLFSQLTRTSFAIILVLAGFGYKGIIASMLFMSIVSFMLYFARDAIKNGEYYDFKNFLKNLSLPSFISNIFNFIILNTQFLILGIFSSQEAVGYFSLAWMIAFQSIAVGNIIATSIFPIISGVQKKETQNLLISYGLRYSLLFSLPIAILIYMFSYPIISIVFRQEYLESTKIITYLLPSSIMFGIAGLIINSLYAANYIKSFIYLNILQLVFYLSSFPVLSYYFSYIGASISFLILSAATLIASIIFSIGKISLYKTKDIIKIVLATLILSSIWYLISTFKAALFIKIILLILSLPVYPFVLKYLNFFDEKDRRVIGIISKRLKIEKIAKVILESQK